LQEWLRGRQVVRARNSVGSCILIDLGAKVGGRERLGMMPALMIELAEWELARGGSGVARSRSWVPIIGSALRKLVGTRVVGARIGPQGITLALSKGFDLTVTSLRPGQVGPGWRLDQWVLFVGDGSAIVQSAQGPTAWATTGD